MESDKAARETSEARVAIATFKRVGQISDAPETRNDLLVAALQERGVSVEGASWDDPEVTWEDYDLVLMQNAWEYQTCPADFRSWLMELESRGIRTWNPLKVVSWNMYKTYLEDLRRHGVDVVDTVFVKSRDLNAQSVLEILKKKGWDKAVVKPCIGADSMHTTLVSQTDISSTFANVNVAGIIDTAQDAMVQEYLPNIRSEGEWSLIYFDGMFSHAVRKLPTAGDFRLGVTFDHVVEVSVPPAVEAAGLKALEALRSLGFEILYARIDLVADPRGQNVLMELELIEPSMFLAATPSAPRLFAEAIMRKLSNNAP